MRKIKSWPFMVGAMLGPGLLLHGAVCEVAQRNPQASDEGPGTASRPWKTIGRAVRALQPGDALVIRGGIYREGVVVKAGGTAEAPIRLEAAPGEWVVLTGANLVTGWVRSDDGRPVWHIPWPHRFIGWSRNMTHPDDDFHRFIGRCEQVAIDGTLLRQVLEPGQAAPGTFCADTTNQALLVWDASSRDPNRLFVEASVRQEILRVEGEHVQVRGLRFRFAANMAQHGAVVLAGRHDCLEMRFPSACTRATT